MSNLLRKYTVHDWILIGAILLIALICGSGVFLHPNLTPEAAIRLGLGAAILIVGALFGPVVVPLCKDNKEEN